MERETGIEPATNSLEGCDSTTELLPPSRLAFLPLPRRSGGQARLRVLTGPDASTALSGLPSVARGATRPGAKDGGEGRTRTFEGARPTDLQSAAFDRFATSPMLCG